MPYPNLVPSSRSLTFGDWPGSKSVMQNGWEVRLIRGTREVGRRYQLTYDNISDANAELFIDHYQETLGSNGIFEFQVPTSNVGPRGGWAGAPEKIGATLFGKWRYASPPTLKQIYPGRSAVSVELVQVLF